MKKRIARILPLFLVLTLAFAATGCLIPVVDEEPRFKVVVELARTQYQVGEEIVVKPHLINMGKRPITVFGGKPILFVKVYDAENRRVLPLAKWPPLAILVSYVLKPQMPHYVEERLLEAYTFTLEQPGRYNIVAWAEFSLHEDYADPLRIYANPVWIKVVAGSN